MATGDDESGVLRPLVEPDSLRFLQRAVRRLVTDFLAGLAQLETPETEEPSPAVRRAARDLATNSLFVAYLARVPASVLQRVVRATDAFAAASVKVPLWQQALEELFLGAPVSTNFPKRPMEAAKEIWRQLRETVPNLPDRLRKPTPDMWTKAEGVIKQLQGNPALRQLRIARWDKKGVAQRAGGRGGALVSAWTAAARFARAFGVTMKMRKSDAMRDWSKQVR